MEKFLGSWAIDKVKTKPDFETFMNIQRITPDPDIAELVSKADPIITLGKDGDGFFLSTKMGDIDFKQGPFKVGEDWEWEDMMNDRTLISKVEFEGDKMKTKTTVKGTDISWVGLRYMDGDTLVSELSGNGHTFTQYLKKA